LKTLVFESRMSNIKRRIILYYKALICPGGAERLFAKEYEYLSALGYDVIVVTNQFESEALFGVLIPKSSIVVINNTGLRSIIQLAVTIRRFGNPIVLCSSGHLDIYLASLVGGFRYALHIHHPCFMSFNDYDKYSIFMRNYFAAYTRSNFGAANFISIRNSLSFFQRVRLNVKAALSIASKRRSMCNFVLSRYAKKEKCDLYGIETEVLCGALDDNFELPPARKADSCEYALLSIARLDVNKRLDELIRAVALLIEQGLNIKLRIVGSGPEKVALQILINQLHLESKVELLGFIPDEELSTIYAKSDLFVSIDWADYKITLFESLSKGLPAIVSDETECDDRLVDLGYVKLVSPTADAVSKAISASTLSPVKINSESITPILQDYTWGGYFRRISTALATRGLLSPPPNENSTGSFMRVGI
jgi:glycosyltransferase involved in cell wall biosynthesis